MRFTPEALRDALLAVHGNEINKREVSAKYNVPIRAVNNAIIELEAINNIRIDSGQLPLIDSCHRKQVFRWASKYTGAQVADGSTMFEKKQALILDLQGK